MIIKSNVCEQEAQQSQYDINSKQSGLASDVGSLIPKNKDLCYKVGDVIRMWKGTKYRVWKITGIHLGGLVDESLVSLTPLDVKSGCAFGKIVDDCIVPYDILITNESIRKV